MKYKTSALQKTSKGWKDTLQSRRKYLQIFYLKKGQISGIYEELSKINSKTQQNKQKNTVQLENE